MAKKQTYVWDKEQQKLVKLESYTPRSGNLGIIEDTIEQTYCHVDGKYYDSKSQMRKNAERLGYAPHQDYSSEYVKSRKPKAPGGIAQDIRRVMDQLERK